MKMTCGELLSVGTGRLCCSIERIYELMNFLTGDNLYTHQLPRAFRECQPWVVSQFPWLGTLDESKCNKDNWWGWVAGICMEHGDEFEVSALPAGRWTRVDPIQEAIEMTEDKDKIIPIQL